MMKLIKSFTFTSDDYDELLFSDISQISINRENQWSELRMQSGRKYDVESDVTDARWVRTRISSPSLSRKLRLMESVVDLPGNTIDGYMLGDGTNAYKWSGAAWVITDPDLKTSWNTEAEINANIASFTSFQSFCVFIRLGTTDSSVTPKLKEVKVLFDADVTSWDETMILNTLAKQLEDNVVYKTEIAYDMPGASSTVNFSTVVAGLGESLDVKEPVQVFNLTDDSNLLIDLFSSYDSGTKIITMSGSVASGKRLLIRSSCSIKMNVEASHPDYIELQESPSLTLSEIDEREYFTYPSKPSIVDKVNKIAHEQKYAKRVQASMMLTIDTSRKFDLFRLQDSVNDFIEANRPLLNTEIDERIDIIQEGSFNNNTSPNIKGIFTSSLELSILFNMFSGTIVEKSIITQVNYTLEA